MSLLKLKQAAAYCDGKVAEQFAEISFNGASMDTREIEQGQLFFALMGETRDGHNYASRAVAKGASAVLAQKPLEETIPAIYVDDVQTALGKIAAGVRRDRNLQVVGITGSVGKTTTKEMTAAVLEMKYPTGKTARNFNNQIGLPMTILGLEEECSVAVLEMGMNHFGEISYLTNIARPNVAVITNIGTMHIEHLGSREGILQAKLEILEGLQENGTAIFNGDEPLLWNLRDEKKALYFGIENTKCDIVADQIRNEEGGVSFHVRALDQELNIHLPAQGKHLVYDELAAISVGLTMDVPIEDIERGLATFQNTGMRQKVMEVNGVTIIADCYNAGPESMEAALNVLAERKCEGKRIAVLGDMLELGARSAAEHYRIGRLIPDRADRVYTYGKQSIRILTGAVTGGMTEGQLKAFDSHEKLAKHLQRTVKSGDVLLFKGSRGMKMEHVLELFLEEQNK